MPAWYNADNKMCIYHAMRSKPEDKSYYWWINDVKCKGKAEGYAKLKCNDELQNCSNDKKWEESLKYWYKAKKEWYPAKNARVNVLDEQENPKVIGVKTNNHEQPSMLKSNNVHNNDPKHVGAYLKPAVSLKQHATYYKKGDYVYYDMSRYVKSDWSNIVKAAGTSLPEERNEAKWRGKVERIDPTNNLLFIKFDDDADLMEVDMTEEADKVSRVLSGREITSFGRMPSEEWKIQRQKMGF